MVNNNIEKKVMKSIFFRRKKIPKKHIPIIEIFFILRNSKWCLKAASMATSATEKPIRASIQAEFIAIKPSEPIARLIDWPKLKQVTAINRLNLLKNIEKPTE